MRMLFQSRRGILLLLGLFFLVFGVEFTPTRLARDFSPYGIVSSDSLFRVQVAQFFWIGSGICCLGASISPLPIPFKSIFFKVLAIPKLGLCCVILTLIFFIPPMALLYFQKLPGVFKFFAGDTFYYLTIAHHFSQTHSFTFDLIAPTNGFHPIWGYFLSMAFKTISNTPESQIYFTMISSLCFTGFAVIFLGALVYQQTGSLFWSVVTLFPGYSYLMSVALNKNYGTLWSFANGMESSFSLLLGSFVFWGIHRQWHTKKNPICLLGLGTLLALCTLARLDDVFLYGAILVFSFLVSKESRGSRVFFLGLPGLLLIGAYLIYNQISVGVMFPVSGKFKQGLGVLPNFYFLLEFLFPWITRPFHFFEHSNTLWPSTSWRIFQMLFPMGIAVGVFLRNRQNFLASPFVMPLVFYIFLKGAYHFFCVGIWHQGQWYYPLSWVASHFLITLTVAPWVKQHFSSFQERFFKVGLGFWSLLVLNSFWIDLWSGSQNQHYYEFFQRRETLKETLIHRPNAPIPLKLLSFEDGIIAYSLKLPSLNGLGFALNAEAADWKLRGELLSYAYQQGHSVLCSLVYAPPLEGAKSFYSSEELQSRLEKAFYLKGERDFQKWHFEVYYRDRVTGALFIRFSPKN